MLILKLVITFSGYILSKNQLKFKTEEHYTLKNTISVVKILIIIKLTGIYYNNV